MTSPRPRELRAGEASVPVAQGRSVGRSFERREPGSFERLLLMLALLAGLAMLIVGGALFTECREYGDGFGPGPPLMVLGGAAIAGGTIATCHRLIGWSVGSATALGTVLGGVLALFTFMVASAIQLGGCGI